jgi:hypothetical protein
MAQQACVNGRQTWSKHLRDSVSRIRETNWRPALAFFMELALFDAVYAVCIGRWTWLIQDAAFVAWCTMFILAMCTDDEKQQEAREEIRDIRRDEESIAWKFEACRMEREGKGWLLWNVDRKVRMPLDDGDTFFIGIPAKAMPEPEE